MAIYILEENMWKIDEKKQIGILMLLGVIIPFITTLFYYNINFKLGKNIFDFPISSWGDGILYYKQVESILDGFSVEGYYGFNESHAMVGKFAAWSPVIYFPFSLLGIVGGWSYTSPIIYNILYWIIAFELFVFVLRPRAKTFVWFSILWIGFGLNHYFALQCMAESFIASWTVIYTIFVIKYYREEKTLNRWLFICLCLLLILSLMRGYCAVFGLPLLYFCIEKKNIKHVLYTCIVIILSLVGYLLLINKCTSPYFWPLINTYWVHSFDNGFVNGISCTLKQFESALYECIELMKTTIYRKEMWFASYIVMFIAILWLIAKCIISKRVSYLFIAVIPIAFIGAFWMLYDVGNGGRQFICLVCGFFLIQAIFGKSDIFNIAMLISVVYLTWMTNGDLMTLNTDVYLDEEYQQEMTRLSDYLNSIKDNETAWDYTIDWAYGTSAMYGIPTNYALNCIRTDYLTENYNSLKAKHIFIGIGSEAEIIADNAGWSLVDSFWDMNLYRIR